MHMWIDIDIYTLSKIHRRRTQIDRNMGCASVQLDDLPDEILIIIFQKLSSSTLFCSLKTVNKRFNRLVHDSIFTNRLTLVRFIREHLFQEPLLRRLLVFPLLDRVLDRFCLQILPEIHEKVQWLCLESSSMERVLRATDYPNLSALSLWDIDTDDAKNLFSGKIYSISIFPYGIIHRKKMWSTDLDEI